MITIGAHRSVTPACVFLAGAGTVGCCTNAIAANSAVRIPVDGAPLKCQPITATPTPAIPVSTASMRPWASQCWRDRNVRSAT